MAQPVFVTLGRSADATVTPEYSFGRSGGDAAAGQPAVRGFGARLELRWAPAVGARGQVELHAIHDLDREPLGAGGWRLGAEGTHAQRLGDRTLLAASLALASDPVWFRDATGDLLLRSASYRRSDLLVSRGGDALVLEAGAAYLQPLTPNGWGAPAGATDRPEYGLFGAALPVFHRWPSLSATLLPRELGPLAVSGRAGLARFAPASGDARGGFGPADLGAVRGLTGPEREAVTRADARVEVSAPTVLGDRFGLRSLPARRRARLRLRHRAGGDGDRLGRGRRDPLDRGLARLRRHRPPDHAAPRAAGRHRGGGQRRGGAAAARLRRLGWHPGRPAPGSRWAPPAPAAARRARSTRRRAGRSGSSGSPWRTGSTPARPAPCGWRSARVFDVREGRMGETFFSGTATRGRLSADVAGRFFSFDGRPGAAPAPRYQSWLDQFTELRASLSAADRRGNSSTPASSRWARARPARSWRGSTTCSTCARRR